MLGLVTKSKYDTQKRIADKLANDLRVVNRNLEIKKEIVKRLEDKIARYDSIIVEHDKEINKLNTNLKSLKKQNKIFSGRIGGYKKQINKLKKEKNSMMELIQNLITERQKKLKLKKRPTIEELKKYFKKN